MPAVQGHQVNGNLFPAFSAPEGLPSRLRLLCVALQEPSWIALTLHLDALGCHEAQFRWCSMATEALARLRDGNYDCVLIAAGPPDGADGPGLLRAMRTAGCDEPAVLLSDSFSDQQWIETCRLEGEALIAPSAWESPALAAVIERAIRRAEVARKQRRLSVAHDRRLSRERDEAAQLLAQQRRIIDDLAPSRRVDQPGEPAPPAVGPECSRGRHSAAKLPAAVNEYYHELLRTYVIMGSGGLGAEISRLSELVCTAGLGPREVLEVHLERVETLVRGLGNRSTRHVMARADLLALELMMHVGEFYRSRKPER